VDTREALMCYGATLASMLVIAPAAVARYERTVSLQVEKTGAAWAHFKSLFILLFSKTHIAVIRVLVDPHDTGRCDCVSVLPDPLDRRPVVHPIPTVDRHENNNECAEFSVLNSRKKLTFRI
jgi:hypothetical protein